MASSTGNQDCMSKARKHSGAHCAVYSCSNKKNTQRDMSFFRFPKEKERCMKWQLFSQRKDLLVREPEYLNMNCRICSGHFTLNQFMNFKRDKLVWNAVPTILKPSEESQSGATETESIHKRDFGSFHSSNAEELIHMSETESIHKRDFGSFHSSNAEELIHMSEKDYVAPKLPFDLPSFKEYETEPLGFGSVARKKHFYLEDDCTFLNHGAMGSVLKEAMEVAQKWQIHTERQPLRAVDREIIPQLVYSTRRLAKFINCNPCDVVLISNVSKALSSVLQSISLEPGDKIYCLNVTYGALKKLIRHRCSQAGGIMREVSLTFPIKNEEQIVDIVSRTLEPGTRLAVFDHIPSNTPFIMPLQKIGQICKDRGVPLLVDGAHALGALPLDLNLLDVDYYTSNAHKWLCAPKGCAFLYVKKDLQSEINPCVVSHGFESPFHSRFIWQGLMDYSAMVALPTVIDFWETVGVESMRQYMTNLTRNSGTMSLVQLPSSLFEKENIVDYNVAERIQNQLYHRYNIEVPIKAVEGHLHVRISAHIYNTVEEYVKLREAIIQLAQESVQGYYLCQEHS